MICNTRSYANTLKKRCAFPLPSLICGFEEQEKNLFVVVKVKINQNTSRADM